MSTLAKRGSIDCLRGEVSHESRPGSIAAIQSHCIPSGAYVLMLHAPCWGFVLSTPKQSRSSPCSCSRTDSGTFRQQSVGVERSRDQLTSPPKRRERLQPVPLLRPAVRKSSKAQKPAGSEAAPSLHVIPSRTSKLDRNAVAHKPPSTQQQASLQVSLGTATAKGKAALKPKHINHRLVDAISPDEILSIFAKHHSHFNTVNLSTAFHRIAKASVLQP